MEKILNVHHNPSNSDLDEVLYDKHIIANYSHGFSYLILDQEKYLNFIRELVEKYDNVKTHSFKFPKSITRYIYNDNFFIAIFVKENAIHMDMYANTLDVLEDIFNIYLEYKSNSKDKLTISYSELVRTNGPNPISSKKRTLTHKHFKNINEKYYPFIYDIDRFVDEFIFGNEQILLLCGDTGTGKSKFASLIMKKILEDPKYCDYFYRKSELNETLEDILNELDIDNNVCYVSYAKDVELMATDIFWSTAKTSDILILDDLDFVLSSRNESRHDLSKNQLLSNLLSVTDGITEDTNLKVIITTNQPFDELDTALIRDGRLFAALEFRNLSYDEAKDIWLSEGLSEELFDASLEDHFDNEDDISAAKLGSIIKNVKRNNKYIRKLDYIEPKINALEKYSRRRAGII